MGFKPQQSDLSTVIKHSQYPAELTCRHGPFRLRQDSIVLGFLLLGFWLGHGVDLRVTYDATVVMMFVFSYNKCKMMRCVELCGDLVCRLLFVVIRRGISLSM